jgi:hypothetical protein
MDPGSKRIATVAPAVPDVGDQDPAARNSPVVCEAERESQLFRQDQPDVAACYFNDVEYPAGAFVKSGLVVLRCDGGIWVEAGPADSENP